MGAPPDNVATLGARFTVSDRALLDRVFVVLMSIPRRSLVTAIDVDRSARTAVIKKYGESILSSLNPNLLKYELVIGIDADGNGPSENEIHDRVTVIIADAADYMMAFADVAAASNAALILGLRYAHIFLEEFLHPSSLRDRVLAPADLSIAVDRIEVSNGELSHHVGGRFSTTGVAEVRRYVFNPVSDLAQTLRRTESVRALVAETINLHREEILAQASAAGRLLRLAPASNNRRCRDFDLSATPGTINFRCSDQDEDADLAKVFGTARLSDDFRLLVLATRTTAGVIVSDISLSGDLVDLYDFDWERRADNVFKDLTLKALVMLQAGYSTLGNAGKVFRIHVELTASLGYAPVTIAP